MYMLSFSCAAEMYAEMPATGGATGAGRVIE